MRTRWSSWCWRLVRARGGPRPRCRADAAAQAAASRFAWARRSLALRRAQLPPTTLPGAPPAAPPHAASERTDGDGPPTSASTTDAASAAVSLMLAHGVAPRLLRACVSEELAWLFRDATRRGLQLDACAAHVAPPSAVAAPAAAAAALAAPAPLAERPAWGIADVTAAAATALPHWLRSLLCGDASAGTDSRLAMRLQDRLPCLLCPSRGSRQLLQRFVALEVEAAAAARARVRMDEGVQQLVKRARVEAARAKKGGADAQGCAAICCPRAHMHACARTTC